MNIYIINTKLVLLKCLPIRTLSAHVSIRSPGRVHPSYPGRDVTAWKAPPRTWLRSRPARKLKV